jgi:hypothetical protein
MSETTTLSAGNETDALVAIKVMGLTVATDARASRGGAIDPYFRDADARAREEWYPNGMACRRIPRYSTDSTAALVMEDRVFVDGYGEAYCECLCNETFGQQWPSPHFTSAEVVALVRATPLQRCRAALAAMEARS